MTITIIAVGKLREASTKAGVEDYAARIRRMMAFEEIEVPSGAGEEGNGKGTGALRRESQSIEKQLDRSGQVVAMCSDGDSWTTAQFAEWLQAAMNRSVPRVTFVIGGAWGLSREFASSCDVRLSLSAMTFPHELARLMLTEQIYRALTIWRGHPYNK